MLMQGVLALCLFAAISGIVPSDAGKVIGCFKDTGNRDLRHREPNSNSMTNELCARLCDAKGYKYSGTQYRVECFCDNSYGSYGGASNCNMPCPGDGRQMCGGTWALLISEAGKTPAPAPTNVIGCYKDTGNRDLRHREPNSNAMTNQLCAKACAAKGFRYSGTQYRVECFCDNSFGTYGKAGNCNMPCPGDGKQMCGGTWALLISDTGKTPAPPPPPAPTKVIGCYKDTGNRDLRHREPNSNAMTNQLCAKACAAKGFRYSGTQYRVECFCDNSFGTYGKAGNCNMPCPGDGKQMCGGTWALLISDAEAGSGGSGGSNGDGSNGNNGNNGGNGGSGNSGGNGSNEGNGGNGGSGNSGNNGGNGGSGNSGSNGGNGGSEGNGGNGGNDGNGNNGNNGGNGGSGNNGGNGGDGGQGNNGNNGGSGGNGGDGENGGNGENGGEGNNGSNGGDGGNKPEKCTKQKAQFAKNGLKMEAQFEAGSCTFKAKQCDTSKCFCVNQKNGKRSKGKLQVPLGQKYDCKSKAGRCLKKLFKILLAGGSKTYEPQCTARGQYEKKQCAKSGECWCVRKKGGKEIKKTRNKDGQKVKC